MKQILLNTKYLLAFIGGLFFLQLQTASAQSRGNWEKETLMKRFSCITDVEKKSGTFAAFTHIQFDENCKSTSAINLENLLEIYKGVLGEHDSLVFEKKRNVRDYKRYKKVCKQEEQYIYKQYYKNYPVEDAGIKFNLYQGKVHSVIDYLRRVERDLPPKISVEEAICLVDSILVKKAPDRTSIFAEKDSIYKLFWKSTHIYYYFEEASLKEYKQNKHYYPVYIFRAMGWEPGLSYTIIVNPTSGEVSVTPAFF